MTAPPRPLWFLIEGGRPVLANDWKGEKAPMYFAHEGDASWTVYDPANPPTPQCSRPGHVSATMIRRRKPKPTEEPKP